MPPGIGPKPSEYLGWPPTLTVKNVRPWNDCVNETISFLSGPKRSNATRRTSLSAASLASAPELAKNARSPNDSASSLRARRSTGSLV